MKRITNLTVVVTFTCLMIAFCAGSVTTYANSHPADKCLECGNPADSHSGAVIVEAGDKYQVFCCQRCAKKYAKEHHDESHHKHGEHHERDEHGHH